VPDRTVLLRIYADVTHAELDRGVLAQCGIPSFVEGAQVASAVALNSGVRLMVRAKDLGEARAALAEGASPLEPVGDPGWEEPDPDFDDEADRVFSDVPPAPDDGGAWAGRVRLYAAATVPLAGLAWWIPLFLVFLPE
jgi:hypothetical protein